MDKTTTRTKSPRPCSAVQKAAGTHRKPKGFPIFTKKICTSISSHNSIRIRIRFAYQNHNFQFELNKDKQPWVNPFSSPLLAWSYWSSHLTHRMSTSTSSRLHRTRTRSTASFRTRGAMCFSTRAVWKEIAVSKRFDSFNLAYCVVVLLLFVVFVLVLYPFSRVSNLSSHSNKLVFAFSNSFYLYCWIEATRSYTWTCSENSCPRSGNCACARSCPRSGTFANQRLHLLCERSNRQHFQVRKHGLRLPWLRAIHLREPGKRKCCLL